MSFIEWLEAAQTHTLWGQENIPNVPGVKDVIGVPKMAAPGFRRQDKASIEEGKDEVEKWLDEATGRINVHWHIVYLEPKGFPKTPSQNSIRQMKQVAGQSWKDYSHHATMVSNNILSKGVVNNQPSSPGNTIVYIKPTSRVHGLSKWQQIHNIGHAVWGNAKKHLAKFITLIRQAIHKIQQQVHDPQGKMPTWAEMVVVLARLVDLKSFHRIFSVGPGDLDVPKIRVNTALNSIAEAMFELVALYLKNKGRINLRPRCEVGGAPDRKCKLQPNQEIVRKFGVRPWVWEAMEDESVWINFSAELSSVVDEAIRDCVWAKVGGPIYATKDYITTEP